MPESSNVARPVVVPDTVGAAAYSLLRAMNLALPGPPALREARARLAVA